MPLENAPSMLVELHWGGNSSSHLYFSLRSTHLLLLDCSTGVVLSTKRQKEAAKKKLCKQELDNYKLCKFSMEFWMLSKICKQMPLQMCDVYLPLEKLVLVPRNKWKAFNTLALEDV